MRPDTNPSPSGLSRDQTSCVIAKKLSAVGKWRWLGMTDVMYRSKPDQSIADAFGTGWLY
jgi:hypothetical protein